MRKLLGLCALMIMCGSVWGANRHLPASWQSNADSAKLFIYSSDGGITDSTAGAARTGGSVRNYDTTIALNLADSSYFVQIEIWYPGADSSAPWIWGFERTPPTNWSDMSILATTGEVAANLTMMGGVVQSATDLKDLADDGYNPTSNSIRSDLQSIVGTTQDAADLGDLASDGYNPATNALLLVTTATNVTNQVSADVTAISGDALAADSLEFGLDGVAETNRERLFTNLDEVLSTRSKIGDTAIGGDERDVAIAAMRDSVQFLVTATTVGLTAAGVDDIWDEDSTGHYTSPHMAFLASQTGAGSSITDADMGAIADSVWLKDTTGLLDAGKYGLEATTGGASSISDAAMGSIADSVWDKAKADVFAVVDGAGDFFRDTANSILSEIVNIDAWSPITDNDSLIVDQSSLEDMTVATVTDVTNQVTADVTSISGDTPAADSLERMLDGTGATLALSQLNVIADGNKSAIVATGSGTGHGFNISAGATGNGMDLNATQGTGLKIDGGGFGSGVSIQSGGSNNATGVVINSLGATDGVGLRIDGKGASPGLRVTGGSTANAVEFIGGATSGDALHLKTTSGDGLDAATDISGGSDILADINGTITTAINLTTNNDKTGYGLSAAAVDDIWNEDTTGHKTDPQMGFFITQGGAASISDADMGAISDSVWLKDTTGLLDAGKYGLEATTGGAANITDADMAAIADSVWQAGFEAHDGVPGSFGDSAQGWGATGSGGSGSGSDSIITYDTTNSVIVPYITVTMRNLAGTSNPLAVVTTDQNGVAVILLNDSGQITAAQSGFTAILDTINNKPGPDTIFLTSFNPGIPTDNSFSRVYGFIKFTDDSAAVGALVTATLRGGANMRDTAAGVWVAPRTFSTGTDSDGYFFMDIRKTAFLNQPASYNIEARINGRRIFMIAGFLVPDADSVEVLP